MQERSQASAVHSGELYVNDLCGMEWANTCVLLLPCWRSARLAAGCFAAAGTRIEASQKNAKGVHHLQDLARYLDARCDEAQREFLQMYE